MPVCYLGWIRVTPNSCAGGSKATSSGSKHSAWKNSNTPSTLTGGVSSSTNSKGTAGEKTSDEPKWMSFCNQTGR